MPTLTNRVNHPTAPHLEADGQGGQAHAILDLAWPHPEGGLDPEVKQVFTPVTVTGRLIIGHTDLSDPDAPVVVREADIIEPGGAAMAEGRCPRCVARVSISAMDGDTLMVLEHQAGCPAYRRMLAEVPR